MSATVMDAARPKVAFSLKDLTRWIEEMRAEFLKIEWTERDELKLYAKSVVIATFAGGLFIYAIDLFVQRSLVGVDGLLKLVFG